MDQNNLNVTTQPDGPPTGSPPLTHRHEATVRAVTPDPLSAPLEPAPRYGAASMVPGDSKLQADLAYCATLIKSGMLPKHLTTPYQVYATILRGRELGLPPMLSLTNIYVVNGKPALETQLMMGLIHKSGLLQDLVIEDDGKECKVTMTRKGLSPLTTTFSMDDAARISVFDGSGPQKKESKLIDKTNWKSMPKLMRKYKALAECCRVLFPDVIQGVYTIEELGLELKVDESTGERVLSDGEQPVLMGLSPDEEFDRLSDELRKMTENTSTTIETISTWLDINRDIISKIDQKKKEILQRSYQALVRKCGAK